jgi:hypothetical protein
MRASVERRTRGQFFVRRRRSTVSSAGALLLTLGLSAAATSGANAQVRASERAVVSQTIDGTVFTIDYARPRVRGRNPIFGGVVHWGEVWTPGANWATTLEVTRDAQLEGHSLAKGKYSMWMVVQPNAWTLVLDPKWERYHTEAPDSAKGQIRIPVRPETGPFTETLSWTMPEVGGDGTKLVMQWDTQRVTLTAKVRPKHPITVARNVAEPYLGRYSFAWVDSDTTQKMTVDLYYEAGSLKSHWEPDASFYPQMQNSILARIADDWYIPALVKNGELWEMAADMVFEFTMSGGRATGFEVRDDRDNAIARAVRLR